MQEPVEHPLPERFVQNTLSICGDRGKKWLADLPEITAELEEQWSIKAGNPFRNLSYNYVANALSSEGKSVVLKIGLPLDNVEIYGEAAYLQAADGDGAVRLLQFDRDRQAILLERVVPGANLKSFCKKNESQSIKIAIRLLNRILRPAPDSANEFGTLDRWFDGLKRALGATFPQDYAERALGFYADLSADKSNNSLLHGDFHHDNILSARREPFLVIDPKGIVGPVGYDIGVFLNNHHDWLESNTQVERKLDNAITDFAAAFDLDEKVIRKWTFCQMVLSWWWTFDETPEMFGEELGLSDVWKV
jgi:streptomycin 6-kinase